MAVKNDVIGVFAIAANVELQAELLPSAIFVVHAHSRCSPPAPH